MNKQNLKTINSIASLTLCLFILVFSAFAWYATNKQANVTGGVGVIASNDMIHFTDTVAAKKYAINDDLTINTYSVTGSALQLTKTQKYSVVEIDSSGFKTDGSLYTRSGDTFTKVTSGTYSESAVYYSFTERSGAQILESEKSFRFEALLPNERIDVTVGFYMDEACDGLDYSIKLNDITGGSFTLDGKTHYSSGAFKCKAVDLKAEDGSTPVGFTADSEYSFFTLYDINENDSVSTEKNVLSSTWDNDYENVYFTFSIMEDFSQYYELVAKASESAGRLLSDLTFNIGSIFVLLA